MRQVLLLLKMGCKLFDGFKSFLYPHTLGRDSKEVWPKKMRNAFFFGGGEGKNFSLTFNQLSLQGVLSLSSQTSNMEYHKIPDYFIDDFRCLKKFIFSPEVYYQTKFNFFLVRLYSQIVLLLQIFPLFHSFDAMYIYIQHIFEHCHKFSQIYETPSKFDKQDRTFH